MEIIRIFKSEFNKTLLKIINEALKPYLSWDTGSYTEMSELTSEARRQIAKVKALKKL